MADFFNNSIEGFNEVLKALDKVKKALLEQLAIEKKAVSGVNPAKAKTKDINTLAKAEQNLVKVEKELVKVSAEEIKIEKELTKINSEQNKIRVEGNLIKADARKKVKELAKANLGLTGEYRKQSKRLNTLVKRYQNLAAAGKASEKSTIRLKKRINSLDTALKSIDKSVGRGQRSVGLYTKGFKDAIKESGLFSRQLGILNQIQASVKALMDANTAATQFNTVSTNTNAAATKKLTIFQKGLALATGGATKAMKLLSKVGKASFIGVLAVALGGLIAMFTRTQGGIDSLSSAFASLKAGMDVIVDRFSTFGEGLTQFFTGMGNSVKSFTKGLKLDFLEATNVMGKNDEEIKKLQKEIKKLDEQGSGSGLEKMKNAFKGTWKEIKTEVSETKKLEDATHALRDAELLYLIQKAKLRKEIQSERLLARDEDKTNTARLKHLIKAGDLEKELLDIELEAQTERVRILQEKKDMSKSLFDEEEALAEAKVALIDMETASISRRRTIASEEITFKRKIAAEDLARFLNNEKRRISLIEDLRLQALENEQLRFEQEYKAAKKNDEDLELVELVHQKKLKEIRDRFRMKDVEGYKSTFETKRKLNKTAGDETLDALAKQIAEEERLAQEKLERELELAELVTSGIADELDKRNKLRQKSLDNEKSMIEKNIDLQSKLAANGLENQLAFEKEQLAKNQLKQIEQAKKSAAAKEAIRLAELFLTLKEAEAQEKIEGSTQRALQGVAEAKAITQGIKATLDIAGFETGGYTGEYGTSEVAGVVHGQEFVIDANTTAAMGLKGADMGDFNSMFSMHEMNKQDRVVQDKDGNYKVIKAVEELIQVTKNKPNQQINVDELGNIIETINDGTIKKITKLKTRKRL